MRTPERTNVRHLVVCCERDGPILNSGPFFGADKDWKDNLRIARKAIKGIKKINSVRRSHFYITVNEPGIAVVDGKYGALTRERVDSVNKHLNLMLKNGRAEVNGFIVNPYITKVQADEIRNEGMEVREDHVLEEKIAGIPQDVGSINKVLQRLGFYEAEEMPFLYVVGTRLEYVKAGLRAGGAGVIIGKEGEFRRLVDNLRDKYRVGGQNANVYVAEDFVSAGRHIKTEVEGLRRKETDRTLERVS